MRPREEGDQSNVIPQSTTDINAEVEAQEQAARAQAQQAAANTTPGTTYYGNTSNAPPTVGENLDDYMEKHYSDPARDQPITSDEKKQIIQSVQKEKAEETARRKEANDILDIMGLKDAYGDTFVEGKKIYARPVRLGAWER